VTHREFLQALDSVKALITISSQNVAAIATAQHERQRQTLDELHSTLSQLHVTLKEHIRDDAAVENRLVVAEEFQKRLTWMVFGLIPGSIGVYEALKHIFGK